MIIFCQHSSCLKEDFRKTFFCVLPSFMHSNPEEDFVLKKPEMLFKDKAY